jgi:hypothetical protein
MFTAGATVLAGVVVAGARRTGCAPAEWPAWAWTHHVGAAFLLGPALGFLSVMILVETVIGPSTLVPAGMFVAAMFLIGKVIHWWFAYMTRIDRRLMRIEMRLGIDSSDDDDDGDDDADGAGGGGSNTPRRRRR